MYLDKFRLNQCIKKTAISMIPWIGIQIAWIGISWLFDIPCYPLAFLIQIVLFASVFRYRVEQEYGSDLDFSHFDFLIFIFFGHVVGCAYHFLGLMVYHSPPVIATYAMIYYCVSECVKKLKK